LIFGLPIQRKGEVDMVEGGLERGEECISDSTERGIRFDLRSWKEWYWGVSPCCIQCSYWGSACRPLKNSMLCTYSLSTMNEMNGLFQPRPGAIFLF
jgi:hypothetical protein